jgi:UDP-glucose 4-epimerase
MSNLFITGAGGFLAQYLAAEFKEAGWRVFGLGRSLPTRAGLYDGGYLQATLPAVALADHLRDIRPDLVIHAAGTSSIAFSLQNPAEDFAQNVTCLRHLLEQLRLSGSAARVIQLSSAAIYGQPERFPITEETRLQPISPYGFHKLQAETVAREFHDLYGMEICSLRIFSAYGPGLKRQVIWELSRKARLNGVLVLEGTGSEERDFIHARDVAQAARLVEKAGAFDAGAYNIAVGTSRRLAQVAAQIGKIAKLAEEPRFEGKNRIGNPTVWTVDPVRLCKLGFMPSVPWEEGLKETVEWSMAQS